MLNVISEEHLLNVCKRGQKECCAYIGFGPDGWECLKVKPGMKATIDARLAEGSMRAKGDNCAGWGLDESTIGD